MLRRRQEGLDHEERILLKRSVCIHNFNTWPSHIHATDHQERLTSSSQRSEPWISQECELPTGKMFQNALKGRREEPTGCLENGTSPTSYGGFPYSTAHLGTTGLGAETTEQACWSFLGGVSAGLAITYEGSTKETCGGVEGGY